MPYGNLEAASPSLVFPKMTYISYAEGRIFPGITNFLHDGTYCASLITDTVNPPESIRTYRLSARLTPTAATALISFYESLNGPQTPFLWYNPLEVEPGQLQGSNYDPTGTNTIGRHIVKFTNGAWQFNADMARSVMPFSFLDVA